MYRWDVTLRHMCRWDVLLRRMYRWDVFDDLTVLAIYTFVSHLSIQFTGSVVAVLLQCTEPF